MIKTRLRALAVLLAAPGLIFCTVSTSVAQSKKPPLSVAVVDVSKVLRDSKAMKGVREEAEKVEKSFKADYAEEVKRLQEEEQELLKQQPLITGREFERRLEDLTRQLVNLRRKSQSQGRLLNEAYQKVLGRFREEIVIVVKAMAVEEGFTLVLNQATAIHVAPQFDITDVVLARLDKRMPSIDFKIEGVADTGKKPTPRPKRRSEKK